VHGRIDGQQQQRCRRGKKEAQQARKGIKRGSPVILNSSDKVAYWEKLGWGAQRQFVLCWDIFVVDGV